MAIKLGNNKPFELPCPKCASLRKYSSQKAWDNAKRRKSSCGVCATTIDLTGRVFKSLTVLRKEESKTYTYSKGECTRAFWLCRCDGNGRLCKGFVIASSGQLLQGRTHSCGCQKSFKESSPITWLFGSYKNHAKGGSREFQLSKEVFSGLVSSDCDYCGRPPLQKVTSTLPAHFGFVYNGVDRIDSTKGYIEGNVVPCCKVCNEMKMDRSREEFLADIEAIHEHQKQQKILTRGVAQS